MSDKLKKNNIIGMVKIENRKYSLELKFEFN